MRVVGDQTATRSRNAELPSRAFIEQVSAARSAAAIRRKVLRRLHAQGATEQSVEDAFQTACERGVAGACHAQTAAEAYAWLHRTTLIAVIDDLRHRGA
jgi:DNA-directed RNA polymerase specialized sigma24 family protein